MVRRKTCCASHDQMRELTAPLGLKQRPEKCLAYSTKSDTAAALAVSIGATHAPDGIVAAGAPLGDAAFTAHFVRERTVAIRSAVQSLRVVQLYLDAQNAFLLLRWLLSSRLRPHTQNAHAEQHSSGRPAETIEQFLHLRNIVHALDAL